MHWSYIKQKVKLKNGVARKNDRFNSSTKLLIVSKPPKKSIKFFSFLSSFLSIEYESLYKKPVLNYEQIMIKTKWLEKTILLARHLTNGNTFDRVNRLLSNTIINIKF